MVPMDGRTFHVARKTNYSPSHREEEHADRQRARAD